MAKYSEQFKLAVVEQYIAGIGGHRQLAHKHSVPYSTVKKWVDLYKAHGTEGLAKKFSHYDAPFRLAVLQHMWRDSLSYKQAAAAYNIRSEGCIAQWERCYHSGGIDALAPQKRGRPPNMPSPPKIEPPESLPDPAGRTHDELVAEVNQLRMEVAYLKKLEALVRARKQQRPTTPKKRK